MGKIGLSVPYLRRTRSGYYWEPSRRLKALGMKPRALGPDDAQAIRMAKELNAELAKLLRGEPVSDGTVKPGTIAAVIKKYQQSRKWQRLAPKTRRGYRQCLQRIETKWGAYRPEAMSRPVVKAWQETLEERSPAFASAILRVLRIVMVFAKDMGHKIVLDEFARLDLYTAIGDGEPWDDWEISAYVDEAKRQGRQSMALALMLGVCLGQREGDVIHLPRSAYDEMTETVSLRQRKTGKAVSIPALKELRREIAIAPLVGPQLVVSEKTKRPYGEDNFRHVHRKICRAAGIEDKRKFMHLRHTAATRLGDAGCSEDLIRSVTGHTSQAIRRYVRQTSEQARAAITKLEDHRDRTKSAPRRNRAADGNGTRRK